MPFSIVIQLKNKEIETSPIVNDNPSSELGFEDPKIQNKCALLVHKLKKDTDVINAFVKHTL